MGEIERSSPLVARGRDVNVVENGFSGSSRK